MQSAPVLMQVSGDCVGLSDVSNLTSEALNQRDTA